MNNSLSASENSSGLRTGRIMSERDGKLRPIFDLDPIGPPSPSPSLLVERFDLDRADWQTHVPDDHLITLFLAPVTMQKTMGAGSVAEMRLARGHVVISRRHVQESARWNEAISILCTRIAGTAVSEAAHEYPADEPPGTAPTSQVIDIRLTNLLYALEAERSTGYLGGRLFLDGLEAAMASLLVKHAGLSRQFSRLYRGGLAPRLVRRVIEYMQANIDKQLALKDLAACVGLSSSHFAHQFHVSTGRSPHQFMLRLRVEQSKQLLREGDMSVLEVALRTGFQNHGHFATVFRRLVGASPSAFRREL